MERVKMLVMGKMAEVDADMVKKMTKKKRTAPEPPIFTGNERLEIEAAFRSKDRDARSQSERVGQVESQLVASSKEIMELKTELGYKTQVRREMCQH